jgi:hypothetical protein
MSRSSPRRRLRCSATTRPFTLLPAASNRGANPEVSYKPAVNITASV